MDLIAYLKQKIALSEEMEMVIDRSFQTAELARKDLIHKPQSYTQKIVFFEKGMARAFYYQDDKTITHYFFVENTFHAPIESLFYNHANPYGLEIIDDARIRYINYHAFEDLIQQFPELERFIRFVLIDALKVLSDKLYSIQFQSATQRYQHLMDTSPEILLKAPLGYIASYLGITQQTLSVIRGGK